MIKDSLGRTFYSHTEGEYSLAQGSSIAQDTYNDRYNHKYAKGYSDISGNASWKNAWEAVANMEISAEETGKALKTVSKAFENVQSINYNIQPVIDDYNYDWKLAEEPKENVVSFKPNAQLKGCKICLAYDTEENWRNSDRILLKGEVAFVEDIFGRVHMRVGNGEDLVLNCPKLMC